MYKVLMKEETKLGQPQVTPHVCNQMLFDHPILGEHKSRIINLSFSSALNPTDRSDVVLSAARAPWGSRLNLNPLTP